MHILVHFRLRPYQSLQPLLANWLQLSFNTFTFISNLHYLHCLLQIDCQKLSAKTVCKAHANFSSLQVETIFQPPTLVSKYTTNNFKYIDLQMQSSLFTLCVLQIDCKNCMFKWTANCMKLQ